MSLFSKFTSIFHSSQTTQGSSTPMNAKLEQVLKSILKPTTKFDPKLNGELLFQYIIEKEDHIDNLFNLISLPSKHLLPLSIAQLLVSVHQLFQYSDIVYDIAIKLRETKLKWDSQDKENWNAEQLQTEPDQKGHQVQFNTEVDASIEKPIPIFVRQYFSYLQRVATNIDLYRAVSKGCYPYTNEKEQVEPKLMFLWHYKLQNLLNSAICLLKYDVSLADIQKYIYYDIWRYQKFLCSEIPKIVDSYATLPNSDTLSLYEIFIETNKNYEKMKIFQVQAKIIQVPDPYQPTISNQILQDFLGFVSKLKVLNQITFKKSLKVPNKQNPCMGVPMKNPNALHIRSCSGGNVVKPEHNEEDVVERKSDTSINELQDQVDDLSDKKKNKKIHLRGQSTFQNN